MARNPTERCLDALSEIIAFHSKLKKGPEDNTWGWVIERIASALGARAATYYACLPGKGQLQPRSVLGVAAPDIAGSSIDIRTGLCGWVAREKEPLLVEDAYKDERFFRDVDELTGFRTRSVVAVPLEDGSELKGVVQVLNKRAGPFSQDDLRFVQAACRATALALRALRARS